MTAVASVFADASALAAQVSDEEYARLLGWPRGRPLENDLAERAAAARAWYSAHGRPWVAARRLELAAAEEGRLAFASGEALDGRAWAERRGPRQAHALAAIAVSAGPEAEAEARRHWSEGRPDEGFFLDRLGTAVAEQLVRWASVWVCRNAAAAGETAAAHLSPGCGSWPLTDQPRLFALLAGTDTPELGPLRILSSGMLSPANSLLAVVPLTRGAVAPSPKDACRECDLSPCTFRRAPYRRTA